MAKTIVCKACGEEIRYGVSVCPECGQQLSKVKTERRVDKHETAYKVNEPEDFNYLLLDNYIDGNDNRGKRDNRHGGKSHGGKKHRHAV
jgi:predicted RNA-binding Zn-ribbon protein involved in translation (DUF1610 family)